VVAATGGAAYAIAAAFADRLVILTAAPGLLFFVVLRCANGRQAGPRCPPRCC